MFVPKDQLHFIWLCSWSPWQYYSSSGRSVCIVRTQPGSETFVPPSWCSPAIDLCYIPWFLFTCMIKCWCWGCATVPQRPVSACCHSCLFFQWLFFVFLPGKLGVVTVHSWQWKPAEMWIVRTWVLRLFVLVQMVNKVCVQWVDILVLNQDGFSFHLLVYLYCNKLFPWCFCLGQKTLIPFKILKLFHGNGNKGLCKLGDFSLVCFLASYPHHFKWAGNASYC